MLLNSYIVGEVLSLFFPFLVLKLPNGQEKNYRSIIVGIGLHPYSIKTAFRVYSTM
jgi:hypothetical protein